MAQAAMGAAMPKADVKPPPSPSSLPLGADTELAGLQAKAKDERRMNSLGQAVTDYAERPDNLAAYAMRLGGGGSSTPPKRSTLWDGNESEHDIKDLEARRKSGAELKAAAVKATDSAEDNDPNSATAASYRTILAKFSPDLAPQLEKATPKQMKAMAPWLEKIGADATAMSKAEALAKAKAEEDAKKEAQHITDKKEAGERSDRAHADSMENAAASRAIAAAGLGVRQEGEARDAAKFERGTPTSPTTLEGLSDAEVAIGELDKLGARFKELGMSGPVARASGVVTEALGLSGTDAAEYQAAALRAMQGVGKIMEGGKLAAGDETKYRRMLPIAGDKQELAEQKTKEAAAFLRSLKDQRIKVLRAAHYDVPDVGGAPKAAVKSPTHYLVSPDKKLKVPVYADGTEGPEEPNG